MTWELMLILLVYCIISMILNTKIKDINVNETIHEAPSPPKSKTILSDSKKDAIYALQSLGYSKQTAFIKVRELPDDIDVEEMIKRGLSK